MERGQLRPPVKLSGEGLVILLMLALSACRGEKRPPPSATCTRAGDQCEYAPGKLGVCIESATGSPPLLCQSQH